MKKILATFLATSLILLLSINSLAKNQSQCEKANECGISWFVKRNGNKQPVFSDEQMEVVKYGAYYIDSRVTDESADKVLYLTFDTGYENGNTSKILDVLKEKDVPAAFFVLEHLILKNTELVKRMANDGHLVCNHTKNHKNISSCAPDEIKNNLNSLEKTYNQKTGMVMSKFFRFPEGRYSIDALKHLNNLGYKTIFWSFAYDDWDNNRQPDFEKAKEKVLANTHNGAIILLHSTSSTNAAIMPELIDTWRKMGYRFATLEDLVK